MIRYEHAIQAATEYGEGLKIRKQIKQLSTRSLAQKFERTENTIRDIEKGKAVRVPDDERRLIDSCIRERQRLEGIYQGKTMEVLKAKYRTSRATITQYLECES